MVSPIGTDTVSSIARRYIVPQITDNIYKSNPLFFRLTQANKKMISGGYQIEVPVLFQRFNTGGTYSGFDLLDVAPQDTVKNAVFDWAQYYVTVAIDGRTLLKVDSPDAIANIIQLQFRQAQMEMAENLATGIYSTGSDAKGIVGLGAAVDDATAAASYAGITRSSNTWWKAVRDASTSTLTMAALNSNLMAATYGGKSPTLIASRYEQYNRYYALAQAYQRFVVPTGGADDQLGSAGFTNLLFNNIPWVVDSHVGDGPNSSNSNIYMLNEEFIDLGVTPRADFELEDFQTPPNQDAMVAKLLWAGQLLVSNCRTHAVLSNISA